MVRTLPARGAALQPDGAVLLHHGLPGKRVGAVGQAGGGGGVGHHVELGDRPEGGAHGAGVDVHEVGDELGVLGVGEGRGGGAGVPVIHAAHGVEQVREAAGAGVERGQGLVVGGERVAELHGDPEAGEDAHQLQVAGKLGGERHHLHRGEGVEGLHLLQRSWPHGPGLGAELAWIDVRPLEVDAEHAGGAGGSQPQPGADPGERLLQRGAGGGDRGGEEGGGAVPRVEPGEHVHRLAAVHQVGATAAVHVQVDEAGEHHGGGAGAVDGAAVDGHDPLIELDPALDPSSGGEDHSGDGAVGSGGRGREHGGSIALPGGLGGGFESDRASTSTSKRRSADSPPLRPNESTTARTRIAVADRPGRRPGRGSLPRWCRPGPTPGKTRMQVPTDPSDGSGSLGLAEGRRASWRDRLLAAFAAEDLVMAALVLLVAAGLLLCLGDGPLQGEEPRRGLVALEMAVRGNLLVPTTNGALYFNKPPLFNWVLLACARLFGSWSEWVLRLPSVVSMLAMALAFWAVARRHLARSTALAATAILLTSPILLFYGTLYGEGDVFYTLLVVLQVLAIFTFEQADRPVAMFVVSYLAAALGFLTKGLPSLAFQVLTLAAWLPLVRRPRWLLSWAHLAGIAAFALCVGGYFAAYAGHADPLPFLAKLLYEGAEKTAVGRLGGAAKIPLQLLAFPLQLAWLCFPGGGVRAGAPGPRGPRAHPVHPVPPLQRGLHPGQRRALLAVAREQAALHVPVPAVPGGDPGGRARAPRRDRLVRAAAAVGDRGDAGGGAAGPRCRPLHPLAQPDLLPVALGGGGGAPPRARRLVLAGGGRRGRGWRSSSSPWPPSGSATT